MFQDELEILHSKMPEAEFCDQGFGFDKAVIPHGYQIKTNPKQLRLIIRFITSFKTSIDAVSFYMSQEEYH